VVVGQARPSALTSYAHAQINMTGPQPTAADQIGTYRVRSGLTGGGDVLSDPIQKLDRRRGKGMRARLLSLLALTSVSAMAGSALAAGTDNAVIGATYLRVGIVAYCADLYHNAGDTGLQSNKPSIQDRGRKGNLADLADDGVINGSNVDDFGNSVVGYWFLDGPFAHLGQYGGQNILDYLAYDDGIDRVRDLQLIDGDMLLPTGTQLINNFDVVIAYTDNKCGEPIPVSIANSAAKALSDFVAASTPAAPKKLILTGFAFSSTLGFGNGIYANGLSPLTRGGPDNACTRDAPCFVGTCPDGCANVGSPPECRKLADNSLCTVYQPVVGGVLGTNNADQACREFLNSVKGPTSSSWATALTSANVGRGASLCLNYDDAPVNGVGTGVPFLAINAARNIIALNAFPPDAVDIQKFWYGCLLGNLVQYLSGDTARCGETAGTFCY
jgi:hypothetical protein